MLRHMSISSLSVYDETPEMKEQLVYIYISPFTVDRTTEKTEEVYILSCVRGTFAFLSSTKRNHFFYFIAKRKVFRQSCESFALIQSASDKSVPGVTGHFSHFASFLLLN